MQNIQMVNVARLVLVNVARLVLVIVVVNILSY